MAADVLDRIKKLLALSASSNPHEAAVAAARAQELMFEHKIEAADLEVGGQATEAEAVLEDEVETPLRDRKVPWRGSLANAVAKSMGCGMFWRGYSITMVGRRSDVQAARYVYGYLRLELERLAADGWRAAETEASSFIWKTSFYLGAVREIRQRLERKRGDLERAAPGAALVLVRRDEGQVAAYLDGLGLRKSKSRGTSVNWAAYGRGQRAGREVQIGGARGAIAGSKARLA